MIVDALETGVIRGDGPFYPQVETPIRPRPFKSFRDRTYAVGMSPDSVQQAATLGARLMTFSQQPWELYAEGPLAEYRKTWAKHHATPPPPRFTLGCAGGISCAGPVPIKSLRPICCNAARRRGQLLSSW